MLCENLFYAGDLDGILSLSTEAIRIADEAGSELFAGGMRNYQAFVFLQRGDAETAQRLLDEGDALLARHDEKLMRTWNLEAQGLIAMMQERLDDAVEIRERQVQMARDVGYERAVALSLQGLGMARAAAGEFDAAETAYLDGLAIFEHMGYAAEMAAILTFLARIRAQVGEYEQAVELLACAQADPASAQHIATEGASLGEVAETELADLEARMSPDAFAAAREMGAAIGLEIKVKELLSGVDHSA